MKSKEKAVSTLTKGIEGLFKKNKTTYFKGHAALTDKNTISVTGPDGTVQTVTAKNIIIATGSEPMGFPGITIDEKTFVTSTGALSLTSIPKKMVVIGGGIIGLEMASVWSRLGTQVDVVEYMPSIGAGMDAEMARTFHKILVKQGLTFRLGTKVLGATKVGNSVIVDVEPAKGGPKEQV